jgi:hypothetical protein
MCFWQTHKESGSLTHTWPFLLDNLGPSKVLLWLFLQNHIQFSGFVCRFYHSIHCIPLFQILIIEKEDDPFFDLKVCRNLLRFLYIFFYFCYSICLSHNKTLLGPRLSSRNGQVWVKEPLSLWVCQKHIYEMGLSPDTHMKSFNV